VLTETDPVQLSILTGDQAGGTVRVGDDDLLIGRAEDVGLRLRDANVSRRHATIRVLADGTAELRDLDSANGTFVNGERVERAVLRGGDQVQLGDTVMHVRTAGAESRETGHPPPPPAGAAGPTNSMVIRALRSSSIMRALRADSAIQRLVIAPELKRTRRLTVAALGIAVVAVLAVAGFGLSGRNGIRDAVAAVQPSTVLVVPQRDGQPNGNGSGWVYDAGRGLIVTNAHVVNDGETFKVSVGSRLVPARVLGVAPCEDLAVLEVAQSGGLESAKLGSQSALKLGDTVVAVGFPQSASATADLTSTAGVVSVVKTTYSEEALDIPSYPNVLQTDAAINPGNSGGPLVDLDGRLVGVNSAGRTTSPSGRTVQGQSYAIGVDRVKRVVPQLAAGHSLRWAGMDFRYPSQEQLARQGLPSGIYIDGAVKGSPADAAGLGAETALLTAVNGRPTANTLAGWCAATSGLTSGQTATLEVVPPGARKPQPVRVRLG
jgi:S1-C subfamily serine protease